MTMTHTPGPWKAIRYEGGWSGHHIKQPGSGLADVAYVDDVDFGPEVAKANAQRIIECVNYCEGVDARALAELPPLADLISMLHRLRQINAIWQKSKSE